MLTVVTFKWFDPNGRHNHLFTYTAQYVNRLRNMLARHLSIPHELVCVTDDPSGIDWGIRIVPLDEAPLPGCFSRLMLFRPDAAQVFGGERLLSMDLDVVIRGQIDHLVERPEEFVIWEPRLYHVLKDRPYSRYNASMILMDAGARPQVWERFSLERAQHELIAHGLDVDDQSWISHVLGPNEAIWPWDGEIRSLKATPNPEAAKIVFFNGPRSPAMPKVQAEYPWIKEMWR